jgi:hypothetical protein
MTDAQQSIIDDLLEELIIAMQTNPDMSLVEIIYFSDRNRTRHWKMSNAEIFASIRRFNDLRLGKS